MADERIILDVWGGEQSMTHIARYLPTLEEAMALGVAELRQGYLINMRLEAAWGKIETFDSRAGAT